MSDTIFDALTEDHEKARTLLKILVNTEGASEGREETFPKLVRELVSHAKAEERTLYHAMLDDPKTQDEASHSIKEHDEIEDAIEAVAQYDMSSPHWLPKMKELKSLVEHHLDEEEEETFPAGRQKLSKERQIELGSAYRQAKADEDSKERDPTDL